MWRRIFGRHYSDQRPRARVASGYRIYAVGDVHGRADLLAQLLARIDSDAADHPEVRSLPVFLGDYVDRGPQSRTVIDMLIEHRQRGAVCLRGNHEAMLLQFCDEPAMWTEWAQLGGVQTLMSYGVKPPLRASTEEVRELAFAFVQALPASHRAFLESLPYSFESGDVLFVHAGVRPGVALAKQTPDDLLWIRREFLTHKGDFGKLVVHGHTPVDKPEFHPNRINIDTGAYATGRLSCLILQGDTVELL